MTAAEQRAFLKTLYGERWRKKVDKMSDAQVIAVYARIQSKNAKKKAKENPR